MNPNLIERYKAGDRINHWFVALTFILLALSGLALFHPALFWLTNLFGGGPWTRILHPFIGVVMFVSFAALAVKFWHHNVIEPRDRQWLKQWRDVVAFVLLVLVLLFRPTGILGESLGKARV